MDCINLKLISLFLIIYTNLIPIQTDPVNSELVDTPSGKIRGKTVQSSTGKYAEVYLGIPYAKPPVGSLRFKHPQPLEPWTGTHDATEFGNSCMQKFFKHTGLIPGMQMLELRTEISENCLFLNVWVPKPRPKNAPVLVFIHGGGLSTGSTAQELYDGAGLASSEDIIFVTMNYRVALFGFLYLDHPDIQGNSGLMDQAFALKWVKDNIASFGGNPDQITLFGQSAGAISVGLHMVSPISKGLFQKVIMESGSPLFDKALGNHSRMSEISLELAKNVGCPSLEDMQSVVDCLLKSDAATLMKKEPQDGVNVLMYFPILDGIFLTKHPEVSYAEGDFGDVDMLAGFNKNEGTFFLMISKPEVFNPLIESPFPVHQDFFDMIDFARPDTSTEEKKELEAYYFDSDEPETPESLTQSCESLTGDYLFTCGLGRLAKTVAKHGNNVYNYYFPHRSEADETPEWMGVYHGSELHYVLGQVLKDDLSYSDEEKALSRRIMRYWTNFARTGDPNISLEPNGKDWINWPKYSKEERQYLVLAPGNSTVGTKYRENYCALIQKILAVSP